jgi:hypothetical protein
MAQTTALETVSNYLTDVRTLLLDSVAPYRYDDPSLLTALNVTILEARRLRPDLFVFRHHDKVPQFFTNDSSEFEMEPQFRLAFVYGVCAHALARDQEDVQDNRAATMMTAFRDILIGVKAPPVQGGSTAPQQQGR